MNVAGALSRPLLLRISGTAALGWLLWGLASRFDAFDSRWRIGGALLITLSVGLVAWGHARRQERKLGRVLHVAAPHAADPAAPSFSELDRKDLASGVGRLLITLSRELEAAQTLRATENEALRTALEGIGNGFIVSSQDGAVQFLSPKARQYWAVSADWPRQALRTEALFRARESVYDAWRNAVEQGGVVQDLYESGDGMESLLTVHAPLRLRAGRQEWLTAQLDTSEVALMRLIRRDFVGNLAHELRNALAKLKANAEVAALAPDAADRAKYMQRALQAISELNALQQGLMDLYVLETGLEPLQTRCLHLPTFLRQVYEGLRTETDGRGVTFDLGATPDLQLLLDPQKITRVLTNLVQNALKHTPAEGRITLSAAKSPLPLHQPEFRAGLPSNLSPEEKGFLRAGDAVIVSVRDSGPGIPALHIPRAFERLHRLDDDATQGVGLGLSLARYAIRAHGGLVWGINNQPGPGITFSFSLPASPDRADPGAARGWDLQRETQGIDVHQPLQQNNRRGAEQEADQRLVDVVVPQMHAGPDHQRRQQQ